MDIYNKFFYIWKTGGYKSVFAEKCRCFAKKFGFDLHVSGMPSLFYLRIADDPTLALHQEWVAECVKRGVFFTNHHNHFLNASLTDEDIAETVAVAEEAFEVVRKRHPMEEQYD